MRRRSPDFWSGLALASLGGYIVVQARGWDYLTEDGPGPGFFPLWYGLGILACSIYLVFFGKESPSDWRGAGRALATWMVLALAVAVLKWVGFAISFAALTFFIVAVMYRRPPVVAALVALGVVAGFYAVFPLALGVALP
jgi:putative tricarboxylic transport membrane protein